jgi:hypothetical protein
MDMTQGRVLYKILVNVLKERDHLRDVGVDGRIILKRIIKE